MNSFWFYKFIHILIGLCLSPLIIGTSLLILVVERKMPFFIQERVGKDRKPFNIIKLRTMDNNVITKLGYYLRKCRLDELIQIINVIKGDMNLIGPRPFIKKDYDNEPESVYDRVQVLPGVTGWAQINGPLEKVSRIVEYDRYYIKNQSVLLKLVIILATILTMITGKRLGDYKVLYNSGCKYIEAYKKKIINLYYNKSD